MNGPWYLPTMDSKINDTSDYVNKGKKVEYSEV